MRCPFCDVEMDYMKDNELDIHGEWIGIDEYWDCPKCGHQIREEKE